jgi:ABC-type multidrug transport system ATPase subunit
MERRMPTAALSVRDMTHWYVPDHTVLDGADLTVDRGEVVVVRGPNGSGKTTLLLGLASAALGTAVVRARRRG